MGVVSGWRLQTKSSKRGMPWAFLVRAISGEHWGRNGLTHRSKVFCVPTRVDPCPFLLALAVLALLGLSWWPQFRYGVLVYGA